MALNRLYRDPDARAENRIDGLQRVGEPRFRWEYAGKAFNRLIHEVLDRLEREEQEVFLKSKTETAAVN